MLMCHRDSGRQVLTRSRSFDASIEPHARDASGSVDDEVPEPAPEHDAQSQAVANDELDADLDDDAEFFASLDETSWELLDATNTETPPAAPMFTKANGQQLKPLSQHALQKAAKRLRLDDGDGSEPIAKARCTPTPLQRSPARPPPPSTTRFGAFRTQPDTPDARRAPQLDTPRVRPSPARVTPKRPAESPRRISLGLTPRRLGSSPAKPFVTPFKKTPTKAPAPAPAPAYIERTRYSGPRMSLRSTVVPSALSWETALRHGVPLEACTVLCDPSQAPKYVFAGPDGASLDVDAALESIKQRGCVGATRKWVQNHWHLILWKFAAYAAARPSDARVYWSWEQLLEQLCYRYERESRKQFSAVKQIQEHRAPSTRPTVLCVHHILRFPEEDGTPTVMLELTDGWYRIRAVVDPPLRRAIDRGKLRVGHKLVVAEARLQSLGDGTPVLDALGTSDLCIHANATSLARWDARMGFRPLGCVSTLARLDPDGGVVPAMDVVIDRVYPLGYVETPKGAKQAYGPEHGAEEEEERQTQWNRDRLAARAAFDQRRRRVEEFIARLDGTVLPVEPGAPVAADVSSRLHALETQDVAVPTDGEWLGALLWAAQQRLLALSSDEALDDLCPPRAVRSFRVVRFHDYLGAPTQRTVQLTVWDPRDDDMLAEGAALRVTHLLPIKRASWRKPNIAADVFLATTADSQWAKLQLA